MRIEECYHLTSLVDMYSGLAVCYGCQTTASNILQHPSLLRVVVPCVLCWVMLVIAPGPHQQYIQMINFCVEYVVWWTGLGEDIT